MVRSLWRQAVHRLYHSPFAPLTPGQRGMQVEASTQVSPAMSTNLRRTKQPTRLVVPVGNFWSRQQVPFLTLLDRHETASDSLLLTVQRKRNTQ